MAFDSVLVSRIETYFSSRSIRHDTKQMMGGLVFMVNEKMCAGVTGDRLMLRVDPDQVASLLKRPGCKQMDFTGRTMRSFVFVDWAVLGTERALREWLDLAVAFNPVAKRAKRSSGSGKRA